MGGGAGARKGGGGGSWAVRRWARRAAGRRRASGGRSVVRAWRTAEGVTSRSSQAATPCARWAVSHAESRRRVSSRRRPVRRSVACWRRAGGGAGRSRYGGEGLAAGRPRPLLRGWAGSLRTAVTWLVAGGRAGDDAAVGGACALATQVAVGLQLVQGGGDAGRALGEAGRQGLDVGAGAGGEGLDVCAEPDREQRQLRVLGEVVADHREAGGVAGVVVNQAGVGVPPVRVLLCGNPGVGVRGHVRVLRIHQEGSDFLGGQALALGLPSRRGPSHVCGCVALSVGQAMAAESS